MSRHIKNFETFKTLSTKEEKDAFLKTHKTSFSTLNEEEKKATRENWKENVTAIKDQVQGIKEEAQDRKSVITILPKDREERQLIETLLEKMNIQFEL